MSDDVRAELAELRGRIERLERLREQEEPEATDRLARTVEERLGGRPPEQAAGQVELSTCVRIPPGEAGGRGDTHVVQRDYALEELLATSPESLARSLDGLAHPARVAICRALLDGPRTTEELIEAAGLNTTGQLYHHLRLLEEVGLVERRSRNLWAMEGLAAFVFALAVAKMLAEWRGEG